MSDLTPIPMGIPWDPWDPSLPHSHAHLYCVCQMTGARCSVARFHHRRRRLFVVRVSIQNAVRMRAADNMARGANDA